MNLEDAMESIIDYRGKTPRKTSSGIPLVTAKIVKGGRILEPQEFIDEAEYESWMRRGIPQEGDVVLTTEAPLGEVAQLPEHKVALAQRIITLRGKTGLLDNRYLKYLLLSPKMQQTLGGYQTGTTVTGIKQSVLRKVPLCFPDIKSQEVIAHILGTLDDKIELNQKMNQTLEDIAKAIFKSWFVYFDPVRAKMEGRPTGLPSEIDELFPDELVDSEIGEIPKGWILEEGHHLYSHQKGLSYKGKFLSDRDDDLPMLNLGSFAEDGKYRREKLKFYCGEFKDRHKIYEGDLLVANTDLTQDRLIIGSPILVPDTPNESDFYLHTHHTTKITPTEDSGLTKVFLYFTFLQDSFRQRVSGFATGTTVLALPKDTFDALQVVIPSASIRSKFEEIAIPILNRCSLLAKEIEVLAELRDTLLPKLISGELRIPDAEKFLEEAGL
ncbi:restriction endonuclease subunit S [Litoricolaceae bacterium]|nr:restriction endonuclease subunit S [Litorivicinaceae bacterium]